MPITLRCTPVGVFDDLHIEPDRQKVAHIKGMHCRRSDHQIIVFLDLDFGFGCLSALAGGQNLIDARATLAEKTQVVVAGGTHMFLLLGDQQELAGLGVGAQQKPLLFKDRDIETFEVEDLVVERGNRRAISREMARGQSQFHMVEPQHTSVDFRNRHKSRYGVLGSDLAPDGGLRHSQAMIERIPFGKTGHHSSRILFGAAALGGMKPERAEEVLALLLSAGVNHIDVAASYGAAEDCLAPWLQRHRDDFFVATKTGDRDGGAARESLERSLRRMEIDQVDMIQLHNLVDEAEWEQAFAPGGAVEALAAAREEGLCRFIGVTGHGTQVAARHRQSLERFPFDAVLLPYNPMMMAQPAYAADFEALAAICADREVALQTIKAVARRRWQDDSVRKFSWYEPLRDPDHIALLVAWVLDRPGAFLNSSSDATLLPDILRAAAARRDCPAPAEIDALCAGQALEPLFAPGVRESI